MYRAGSSAMLEGVAKAVDEKLSMQKEFSCLYKNNRKLEVLIGELDSMVLSLISKAAFVLLITRY